MVNEKVVFRSDFDGVITNPEIGVDAFRQVYTGVIAGMIGIATSDINRLMRDAKDKVQSEPDKHGWIIDNKVVAPYYADHYNETRAYAYEALKLLRQSQLESRNRIPTIQETPEFLNQVFLASHPHIIAPFRDGAREFIEEMNATTNFGFISNSETKNVSNRLLLLFKNDEKKANSIRIIGDAKKQKIDPSFTEINESLKLPGFKRRIYLRRKQYLTTLKNEGAQIVMGDVPELDLYAPVVWGLIGILFKTPRIRSYEMEFFNKHPKGHVDKTLPQAAQVIRDLRS